MEHSKKRFLPDSISVWLFLVMVMIVAMVCIGGITRLTGSGLSITEWKPIMGAIPPLNEIEWQEAFVKYQQIPQFKVVNATMTVSDFKFIFFWEYLHRLVGRLIGIVVILPGLYFLIRKKLSSPLAKRVVIGFILGGAQGFLGWFMVSSGLSELIYVSHLRLAAHLILALIILAYWCTLFLKHQKECVQGEGATTLKPEKGEWSSRVKGGVKALWILLFLQLTYGAFVAGLKAGHGFNTFPKMNDEWLPDAAFLMTPVWVNFFNNMAMVQFIHRWLAVFVVAAAVAVVVWIKKDNLSKLTYKRGHIFLGLLFVQFVLGVCTLVLNVPLVLASLHQLNGCVLVMSLSALNEKS